MRVIIIGAGIGGLVLAHGLRAAGIDVEVYERDRAPEATGGYRLHLDAVAVDVLQRVLPPDIFQALIASAPGPEAFRQFAVMDRHLRTAWRLRLPEDEDSGLLIGRIPLRTLLSQGLGKSVRWDSPCTGARALPTGGVTATLADGTERTADLLIAADGTRSSIAAGLAGRPTAQRLRRTGLAGRAPLTAELRSRLPADLERGPAFAAGPGRTLAFLSVHDASSSTIAASSCATVSPVIESPYLLWGLTLHDEPASPQTNRPTPWRSACAALEQWSPVLRSAIHDTEPDTVTRYPYWAADPQFPLIPWPAGPITALGDAVHAMPPTGGRGAATAIRDADALTTELVRAVQGTITPVVAVQRYHRAVERYAPAAVRESLAPLRAQHYLAGPVLPLLGSVAALRSITPAHRPTDSHSRHLWALH